MKKPLLGLLGLSIFSLGILTSCEDDFTEEDALQRQEELINKEQENAVALENLTHEQLMQYTRLQDSLERIGGVIVYSVRVIDAANANTTNARKAMMEGATVTVIQNGVSISDAADENGMVVFDDMRIGQVNVTVKGENHTSAFFTADITPSGGDYKAARNATTSIPLFPTTVDAGAGVITGKVYVETNLLNDEPEMAVGAKVTASIDVDDSNFQNNFLLNTGAGRITSITYENATVSTTVGEDGTYTLVVPAAIGSENEGLPIDLKFDNFSAQQILVQNNAVDTVAAMFMPGGGSSAIPTDGGVLVSLPDFAEVGSGAEFEISKAADSYIAGDNVDIEVIGAGSGYLDGGDGNIYYTLEGVDDFYARFYVEDGKVQYFTGFVDDFLSNSDVVGEFTEAPKLAALYDYDSGTENDTQGSGAEFKMKYMSEYSISLINGGSGYSFLPSIKIKTSEYEDMSNYTDFNMGVESEEEEVSLGDIFGSNLQIVDGVIRAVNGGSSTLQIPVYMLSVEIMEVVPMERIPAELAASVNSDGEVTAITVIDGGQGYTPGQRLEVTLTPTNGLGSGATAYIDGGDIDSDGYINDVILNTGGSGYSSLGNVATMATASSSSSANVVAGSTTVVNYNYGTGTRE